MMSQKEVQDAWERYLNYSKSSEYQDALAHDRLNMAKTSLIKALDYMMDAHNAWMAAQKEDTADEVSALIANVKHDIDWIVDLNK